MTNQGHDHHHKSDKHAVHMALVQRLRTQAAEVRRLTTGLDEAALSTPTVPGKWSLKELVCHLRRMDVVFADRCQRMLREDRAPIAPYEDPDGDAEFVTLTKRTTDEVVSEYLRERDAFCSRLEALSPVEWHRKAAHPDFPHYDLHFQVEYMAHHEAHHLYQLFQRRIPLGKLPH